MNKILVVEDINTLSNGTYLIDSKLSRELEVQGNVKLYNYDYDNNDIKIRLDDAAELEFYKVNVVSKDVCLEINLGSKSLLNLKMLIINDGVNKVKININMIGDEAVANLRVRVINKNKNSRADLVVDGVINKGTKDNQLLEDLKGLIVSDDTIKISPLINAGTSEVEANHLVTIGSFSKEELFYLNSRGIGEEAAKQMMTESFMVSAFDEEMREKIKMEVINYE